MKHSQSNNPTCHYLSEWEWDRWHLQLLSQADTQRLQLHLAQCTICQTRQVQREAEFAWLEHQPNFAQELQRGQQALMVKQTTTPKASSRPWWELWRTGLSWGLSTAAAAMMILFVLFHRPPLSAPPNNKAWIAKNLFSVRMIYKRPGVRHSRWAQHSQAMLPGTLIQFEIQASRVLHVMIVSINQHGQISRVVPLDGSVSVKLPQGKQMLPRRDALELDDYIGWERIFVVVSDKAFSWEALTPVIKRAFIRAQRDLKHMHTLQGWRTDTLLIRKQRQHNAPKRP